MFDTVMSWIVMFVFFAVIFAKIYLAIPEVKFRRTFGMWPQRWSDEKAICQVQVDKKLSTLAYHFLIVCTQEQEITEKYRLYGRQAEQVPAKDLKRLKKLRRKVSKQEFKFRSANELAESFKFRIKEKAGECLTEDQKRFLRLS